MKDCMDCVFFTCNNNQLACVNPFSLYLEIKNSADVSCNVKMDKSKLKMYYESIGVKIRGDHYDTSI